MSRNAKWHHCPACKSYRFTWQPKVPWGKCQDCGHEVGSW